MNKIISSKYFNMIACVVIAVLILIAYSNTYTSSFHFDDDQAINENPMIKHVTGENIANIVKAARPVVYLSLMFNYALGGLDPSGWHLFNIVIHIMTSILVYLFILGTLQTPSLRGRYAENAKWMALLGGILFSLHPIQTESVTYLISRSELLATCFYIATFLLLIRSAKTGKFYYAPAILITSLLAIGSKEWAITLPALLLLYDFLFLAEGNVKSVLSRWYIYVFAALPWWLVLSRLNLFAKQGSGSVSVGFNVETITGITPLTYLYTSLNVIWTYIRLLILPINQNIDYDYPIAHTLFELPTIVSLLGHLAIVAAAFWLYRSKKWKLIPFGVAWFYIGLSPVQSFVPVTDVIFEHRLYMPSIGFFIAFVTAYDMIFGSVKEKLSEPAKPARQFVPNKSRKKRIKGVSLNGQTN